MSHTLSNIPALVCKALLKASHPAELDLSPFRDVRFFRCNRLLSFFGHPEGKYQVPALLVWLCPFFRGLGLGLDTRWSDKLQKIYTQVFL